MSQQVEQLFENLWQDYLSRTPSAEKVHKILGEGHPIINDHVAFRTFDIAPVGLEVLAQHFLDLGYKEGGDYHFEAKKLRAKHFEHDDPELPKVFISELMTSEFSDELQAKVKDMVAQVSEEDTKKPDFLYSGTHWKALTNFRAMSHWNRLIRS